MNKKIYLFSVFTILILLFTIFPNYSSQSLSKGLFQSNTINILNLDTENIGYGYLNVIKCEKDRKAERTVQKLSKIEIDNLMKDLNEIARSDLDVLEIFEKELEKLKEYNLVSSDTTLEDLFDIKQFENDNYLELDNVTNKPFSANFSPILIVGGGFGLGIGFRKRMITSFSHFLGVLAGIGYVLCVDFLAGIKYTLICFTLPLLLGYIAGYTGIIIFAIFPGLLYSNLAMIGFAPFTIWNLIPNIEE